MPDPRHIAYERLKELLVEASHASPAWKSSGKHTEWKQNVKSALRRIYGESSQQFAEFCRVRYSLSAHSNLTPVGAFDNAFMRGVGNASAIVRSAIREFEDYEEHGSAEPDELESDGRDVLSDRVFVVHGHDNEMKESVARFLERLGLEPVVLHEQASGGATIIEKFEQNSDVSYAIVLLSPDDVGAAKSESRDLQPRSRQNVILELGYFIGRLGRAGVCPLVRGEVEIPSDTLGVVCVPFGGEDWKIHLVRELKHRGLDVDANKAF